MKSNTDEKVILDTSELRFIEGHGRLVVKSIGTDLKAEFHNIEGPRFLTRYLVGKPAEMAPLVASRICGLCYTAHSINSAECVEKALGMKLSKEVQMMRNVLYLANNLRSHMMHLLYLSIPPIEGLISVLRLRDRELFRSGAKLLAKSTELIELWGGRSVHVPNVVVGGFGTLVKGKQLMDSIKSLEAFMDDARKIVNYTLGLELPELERYRPLGSLKKAGSYPIYSESAPLALNDGSVMDAGEFYSELEEIVKDYSTSKQVHFRGSELTVGALSRIILNRRYLRSESRALSDQIEWRINPFLIIKAQAIEVLHYLEELIAAGEQLHDIFIEPSSNDYQTCKLSQGEVTACSGSGEGVSIAEAPRGVLCHSCKIEDGIIKDYRVYTPTAINSLSIELDAVELVKRFKPLGNEKLEPILEDMVRGYDPCLSCAVSLDIYSQDK